MKTILAIGGHIGDMELTAGGIMATNAIRGGKNITLALTAGERGNPAHMTVAEYRVQKIKEAESLLEKYHSDIRNAENQLSTMSSMERNLKLINVLADKQNVESKLPILYNKQRELADSVNTKYQELKELELLVKEYDDVLEQIEALQSEIDNM